MSNQFSSRHVFRSSSWMTLRFQFPIEELSEIPNWRIVRSSVCDSSVTEFIGTKRCQINSVVVMNVCRVFRWHSVHNFEVHYFPRIPNWQIVRSYVCDSNSLTSRDFEMIDCARLCRELMSMTKKCQLVLVVDIYVCRCYMWHFVYNFQVH